LNLGFVVFVEILDVNWYSQFVIQLQVEDITMMERLISSKLANSRWSVSLGFWLINACVWWYWMRTEVLQRLKSTFATDSCKWTSQYFNFADYVESAVLSKTVLVNSSQVILMSGATMERQNVEGLTGFSVFLSLFSSTLDAMDSTANHQAATCTRFKSNASNDTAAITGSGFGLEVLSKLFCSCFHCVCELYFQDAMCDVFQANRRSVDASLSEEKLRFHANLLMGRMNASANSNCCNNVGINEIVGRNAFKSTLLAMDMLNEAFLASYYMVKSRLVVIVEQWSEEPMHSAGALKTIEQEFECATVQE